MDDYTIARKYVRKIDNAKSAKIPFSLSLNAFKNLMKAKKCGYTGIQLTIGIERKPNFTDITIDRIDNSKGYESGNVIAVCHGANQIKSRWEDPSNPINFKEIKKMIKTISKRMT